jgi:hypothetical protein
MSGLLVGAVGPEQACELFALLWLVAMVHQVDKEGLCGDWAHSTQALALEADLQRPKRPNLQAYHVPLIPCDHV